jgi:hypothetical protein
MHIFYAHFAQINEVKWINAGLRGEGNITDLATQVPGLLGHPVDGGVQGITPVFPARLKHTLERDTRGELLIDTFFSPPNARKSQGNGYGTFEPYFARIAYWASTAQ